MHGNDKRVRRCGSCHQDLRGTIDWGFILCGHSFLLLTWVVGLEERCWASGLFLESWFNVFLRLGSAVIRGPCPTARPTGTNGGVARCGNSRPPPAPCSAGYLRGSREWAMPSTLLSSCCFLPGRPQIRPGIFL